MKKHLLALGLSLFAFQSFAADVPAAPALEASAYLIFDAQSGQILTSKNPDARIEPASLTKLMTAYLTFDALKNGRLKLDQQLTASERAWKSEGSRMFLDPKVPVSVDNLIKGMIVQSGNDACVTLAEAIAGSEEGFAQMMNAQAKKLGMNNSHFANSTGLPDPQLYTTVRDLATLSNALIRDFPQYYPTYSIKSFTYNNITQPNRNRLLWRDPSVDGIKTGHHSGAGYCLMSSAKRDEQRLVAVVMGSDSEKQRAEDSLALLNWGFRFYETHKLYEPGQPVAPVKVWKGKADQLQLGVAQPLLVSVPRGRYADLKPSMEVPTSLVAPIEAGQQIGTVKVMLDGAVVAQAPLVAREAVEQAGFFKRLWHSLLMWWESD